MNRAAALVLIGLIRTYQAVISPWVTQQCKYYPSCSAYGLEAVRVHGAVRGVRLTVWRILRCNPWSDGGVDHVPPRRDSVAAPDVAAPDEVKPDALGPDAVDPAVATDPNEHSHDSCRPAVTAANELART